MEKVSDRPAVAMGRDSPSLPPGQAGRCDDRLGPLKELGLHRDAHLVVPGSDIPTSDARPGKEDEVEIFPVISGGRT